MTYWFAVGQLSCAVVSDGQMEPPLAPPLEAFFTPGTGVPERDLREALAAEGQGRTTVNCGYNCLLVETPDGRAVAFWSASGGSPQDDEHLPAALEAMRLFGEPAAPVRVRRGGSPPRPRHRRRGPYAGSYGIRAGKPR